MENIWAILIAISMTQTLYRTPTAGTEANIVTNHQIIRMQHKAPKLLAQIIDTKRYCCGSRAVIT